MEVAISLPSHLMTSHLAMQPPPHPIDYQARQTPESCFSLDLASPSVVSKKMVLFLNTVVATEDDKEPRSSSLVGGNSFC